MARSNTWSFRAHKRKKRILFGEAKGCKMYGTWYEDDTQKDNREQS